MSPSSSVMGEDEDMSEGEDEGESEGESEVHLTISEYHVETPHARR